MTNHSFWLGTGLGAAGVLVLITAAFLAHETVTQKRIEAAARERARRKDYPTPN